MTVDAGSLILPGTLQALNSDLTINVPSTGFSNLSNGVLSGGIYQSVGNGAILDMNVGGGPVVTDAAPLDFEGGEIAFFDPTQNQYVSVETSLQMIAAGGVLNISDGATAQFGALQDNGAIALS